MIFHGSIEVKIGLIVYRESAKTAPRRCRFCVALLTADQINNWSALERASQLIRTRRHFGLNLGTTATRTQ